jgi:hypothetical protein
MRRFLLALLFAIPVAADAPKPSARDALKPFNLLVGSWKGAGAPEGSLEEKQKGHWTETVAWEWQFKGDDAWLTVTFADGKHFSKGEVRATPPATGLSSSSPPPPRRSTRSRARSRTRTWSSSGSRTRRPSG